MSSADRLSACRAQAADRLFRRDEESTGGRA